MRRSKSSLSCLPRGCNNHPLKKKTCPTKPSQYSGINYNDAHAPSFHLTSLYATLALPIHVYFKPECKDITIITIVGDKFAMWQAWVMCHCYATHIQVEDSDAFIRAPSIHNICCSPRLYAEWRGGVLNLNAQNARICKPHVRSVIRPDTNLLWKLENCFWHTGKCLLSKSFCGTHKDTHILYDTMFHC